MCVNIYAWHLLQKGMHGHMQKHSIIKKFCMYILLIAVLLSAVACGGGGDSDDPNAPLRDSTPRVLEPKATGAVVSENKYAIIDASNSSDGYVMVKYLGTNTSPKVRIQLGTSGAEYTYNISASDAYTVFPFSEGDGTYTVKIYEKMNEADEKDTQYVEVFAGTFDVAYENQTIPFLYPNQYVDFDAQNKTVSVAQETVSSAKKDLDAVEAIYNYVSDNVSYDDTKADLVLNNMLIGYLPVVDETLASKTGICFDYAALMTAMLRSQGIPTKLVIGYSGDVYHAWINVYITDIGWIDKIIEFKGDGSWTLMDPTFNSSLKNPKQLGDYIGDGSVYRAMFYY